MKKLHPELQDYQPIKVKGYTHLFAKVEAGTQADLEAAQLILQCVDEDGDVRFDQVRALHTKYIGGGSFSKVFRHPTDSSKVVKIMARYRSDSTCYQYLRLVSQGVLTHEWCPKVHAMGRLKVVHKSIRRDAPLFHVQDMAYVVLDYLSDEHEFDDWETEATDILKIRYEFKRDVIDVYFPYAKLDVRGSNVLLDDSGTLICVDPVWNNGDEEPISKLNYIYKRATPLPVKQQTFINNLRQGIQHARVW